MSWGVLPWVYPVWDSLGFLDLGDYFLPHFRDIFNYYLLKYFLIVFIFVFFFWDSYDSNVGAFNSVLESLKLSSFLLIRFSFFLYVSFISSILLLLLFLLYNIVLVLPHINMNPPQVHTCPPQSRTPLPPPSRYLPHLSYLLPPLFYCWFPPECF